MDGNIAVDNTTAITAFEGRPSNLTIYQTGTGRTFYANNNFDTAIVVAPGSDFVANNHLAFYGAAVFHTIEANNNATVFVDERAMAGFSAGGGGLVQ